MFEKITILFLKNCEKVNFFILAILTFMMAAMDAQRNFMPCYVFFSFYLC